MPEQTNEGSFFVVRKYPKDRETRQSIESFENIVGGDNILVDNLENSDVGTDKVIPQPTATTTSNNSVEYRVKYEFYVIYCSLLAAGLSLI